MNIVVKSRHMEPTEAIREYVESKAAKLTKYYDGLTSIEVILDVEADRPVVEVIAQATRKATFVATHRDADMYACVDQCLHKVAEQIRRHKDKVRNRHGASLSEVAEAHEAERWTHRNRRSRKSRNTNQGFRETPLVTRTGSRYTSGASGRQRLRRRRTRPGGPQVPAWCSCRHSSGPAPTGRRGLAGSHRMKLADIMVTEAIVPELGAITRDEAITTLVQSLADAGAVPKKSVEDIIKAVLARESQATTGIGKGVALPHTKLKGIRQPIGTFGLSSEGIDFNSLDGKPVYSVILLLSSPDSPDEHLQAMEAIFKHVQRDIFRKFLRQAQTTQAIVDLILEADELG